MYSQPLNPSFKKLAFLWGQSGSFLPLSLLTLKNLTETIEKIWSTNRFTETLMQGCPNFFEGGPNWTQRGCVRAKSNKTRRKNSNLVKHGVFAVGKKWRPETVFNRSRVGVRGEGCNFATEFFVQNFWRRFWWQAKIEFSSRSNKFFAGHT